MFPNARKRDLVIQKARDEILIYDLKTNNAHCLNSTSALTWQLCDGRKSVSQISNQMSRELKESVSEDLVWLALDQLNSDGLLENFSNSEKRFAGLSRREVIKKVGFASLIALPAVSSLVAPRASMAQSGGGGMIFDACAAPGECMSNNCLNSTCCSATSTGSMGTGAFAGCNQTPTQCSTGALTFCCSGTATNSTGFSFCTAAETECTCD